MEDLKWNTMLESCMYIFAALYSYQSWTLLSTKKEYWKCFCWRTQMISYVMYPYQFFFQLVECGSEVSTVLLQTCLDQILVKDGDIPPLKKDLVSAVVRYLIDKPHFSTNLSEALSSISINESFLEDISNTLGMSVAEKIGVGLGLLDSNNPDLKMRG